jgi:hypothetical protein
MIKDIILNIKHININNIYNNMYQNKETMKTGVSIPGLHNMSKEIINKLKHLSVPMGLYANPRVKRSSSVDSSVSRLSGLESKEVIPDELFKGLLDISISHDKSKTRKNRKHIGNIKLKINNTITGKRERKLTKKNKKERRRVTKKALKIKK